VQTLEAQSLRIPGDISSAAFWLVGALITPGSDLILQNVGINSTRTGVLDVLQRMGAEIEVLDVRAACGEPVADLHVKSAHLKGTVIEGAEIPRLIDEIPIIALAAACAEGKTEIKDAQELRVKESDRIRAIAKSLGALGARIEERPDGLLIKGNTQWKPGEVDACGDHRMAMTLAIAGLLTPVNVLNPECTETSYPSFWETLERLKA
jgi:3-phosphoshikimate 1-carboxyvinyltransferase